MSFFRCLSISVFLLKGFFFTVSHAATFEIENNCRYTVWAAANPGGGKSLKQGESWNLTVSPGTTNGRIWARTNCIFDAPGLLKCQTGDCNGLLECKAYGDPPYTMAEYSLNQFNNMDFFDISVVYGFNVPMEFSSTSSGCPRRTNCKEDITGQCPDELKAPGGCNNPCTVFKTDQYCCTGTNSTPANCGPTNYSKFFKDRCPNAYSYPYDDATSTFTCPGGTNYKVVFCPFFWYGVMVCE